MEPQPNDNGTDEYPLELSGYETVGGKSLAGEINPQALVMPLLFPSNDSLTIGHASQSLPDGTLHEKISITIPL